jgi:hypothetical protein
MSYRLCAYIALGACAFGSSACATVAYEIGIFSWWDQTTENKTDVKSVVVTSEPQGASVTRKDVAGKEEHLGVTPLVDALSIEQQVKTETPRSEALWIGSALEFGGGMALFFASSPTNGQRIDTARFFGFSLTGTALMTSSLVDLVVAIVHASKDKRITKSATTQEYAYIASASNLPTAMVKVRVPEQAAANIVLARGATTRVAAKWILAVMSVEDASGGADGLAPTLISNVGDQIRIFVAERGVRTIDRGTQEATFKAAVTRMKSESYQSCYASSCQIELGRALAASHILRSRITRFGSRCVLNGELIDLASEVTVGAASSQGACEPEGLLQMSESIARELIGGSSK